MPQLNYLIRILSHKRAAHCIRIHCLHTHTHTHTHAHAHAHTHTRGPAGMQIIDYMGGGTMPIYG